MDTAPLVINLTPEQRQQIEDLARQRGYETPADYVVALIASDAEAHDEPLAARFRRSLQDAITGKTHPILTLWDGIEDD